MPSAAAAAATKAFNSASAELRLTDFWPLAVVKTTMPFTMWIADEVDLQWLLDPDQSLTACFKQPSGLRRL